MQFVVSTQVLENYGAHCEDGKFSSGNAYWKFKGGSDYLVNDCDREADAVAFVMALVGDNSIGWKEFPIDHCSYSEWLDKISDNSEDYQEFLKETIKVVSPFTRKVTQGVV